MRLHPDTLEVRADLSAYDGSARVCFDSRRYDVHYRIQLRRSWGDPRPLVEYIQRLVGGTMAAWDDARVSPDTGREMAHALMPMWEREIHRYMEHLEYQGRRRNRHRDDMLDAMQYAIPPRYYFGYGMAFDAPREDPKAKEKARQLLMRNLDDGQLKSFKKDGEFRVTAKDGKVYTIKTARSFNVVGPDGAKYCGQLRDTPIEDQMLAQKLLLQHEPEKFFKNANISPANNGAGTTATEINMRYQQLADMMLIRPGAIVPWDSSV